MVSCSVELGGNAPSLVFDDADIGSAVDGAMVATMRNGGEACTAANRFYVQSRVAAEFVARLAGRMGQLTVGPGLDEATQAGPLANADSRNEVASPVQDAVASGARVLAGGEAPDRAGCFYSPTVLGDVPPAAGLLREEIFGPVAPIVVFDDEAEAVRAAERHRVRARLLRLHGRPRPRPARGRGARQRDGRAQRGAIRRTVRRHRAERPRPGGGHEGLLEFTERKYIGTAW